MKCINCDEEAQYIYFGASLCEKHFKEHRERVKKVDEGKPVEGPPDKICPKCLEYLFSTQETRCNECGSQLVEWGLICECGAQIRPTFKSGIFGRKPIPYHKHCGHCGHSITKLVKARVKEIRKMLI